MTPEWIAIDWGTTRVRAWAMQGRDAVAEASSDDGMGTLDPDGFAPALARLTGGWEVAQGTLAVACGMVGARGGWREAPYAAVPCPPLGADPVRVAAGPVDLRILPGLKQSRPPDVMRGEETQIAGLLARDPGFDGVALLPGSHTKWVQLSAGEVVSFQTAMTGEVFAALSRHTVLARTLGDGWDDEAFAAAVADALSSPESLAVRLFRLRAGALLDGLEGGTATARLSGLLVGAELAASRPYWLGQRVAIVGEDRLSAHYAAALSAQGADAERHPVAKTTLAGLCAARDRLKGTT